jgi:Pentapeptide repeats (8 copies)
MHASEVKDLTGAIAAMVTALVALLGILGIPTYIRYRTRRDKMTLVRDAFESVVKSLASAVEVERVAGAILLRRFFDPTSEVGIASAPYTKEVVNVITSALRSQPTGTLQKILVDGLAYAPSLRYVDLQRANLQNAYLGPRPVGERTEAVPGIVDVSYADFYRSDLSGGSIKGAIARGAVFYQARLQNTVLKGADLRSANFFEADLHGAMFEGALLKGASFKNARRAVYRTV